MCFSSPNVPDPKAPPATPTEQDPAVQASLERERRRQAMASGYKSTIQTGGAGVLAPATTAGKSLLGQ